MMFSVLRHVLCMFALSEFVLCTIKHQPVLLLASNIISRNAYLKKKKEIKKVLTTEKRTGHVLY